MIRKLLNKIFNRIHFYRHMRPSKIDSVFVVSTGRTGTKFFESFFNLIDEKTFAVHEPRPDFFDLGMNKLRKGWTPKQVEDYIKIRRGAYLRQYSRNRIKRYVECNPFLPVLLNEIKGVFKKSKFIVITREPKSYVESALNKSPGDDGKSYMYDENDQRLRLRSLDFADDEYHDRWSLFSRLEKISWYWNRCNLLLVDFIKENKNNCLHLKFEDLFSVDTLSRKQSISKINKFLDLKIDNKKMNELVGLLDKKQNSTKEPIFKGFNDWTEQEKDKFYHLTKEANTIFYGE